MLIRDVLAGKGWSVVTLGPGISVLDAARVLVEHRIGSVVVTQGQRVLGIVSERDVLRLTAKDPDLVASTLVRDIMTTDIVVGLAADPVDYALRIMTNNRVRHLPIMESGVLVGIVSIGDLVNATLSDLQAENRWLREYLQGGA